MIQQIKAYTLRDFQLEWKNRTVIGSSIIYLISVVFISLHAFESIDPDVWNALFWIIMVFSSLTVVGRSFQNESGSLFKYHYHLVKPEVIISSKLISNSLFCLLLGLIAYIIFSIFLGNEIKNQQTMLIALLLGSIGLGCTFTLTSALSSRVNGNLVLTSILSLPLLLPLIIVIIRLTERSFVDYNFQQNLKLYTGLLLLNFIIATVSYVLFPYLWRD